MDYYQNKYIADTYNVSVTSVARWIKNARDKKNNLVLQEKNGKYYIANSSHNNNILANLKKSGKINKPKTSYKLVKPTKKFFKIFNEDQILSIINSLETRKEIQHKFTYIDKGADIWDNFYQTYSKRLKLYSTPRKETTLMEASISYLKYITNAVNQINLLDVGPGNAFTVIDFLKDSELLEKLNKYVALDISDRMNEIAISNFNKNFPEIATDRYLCDTELTNFDRIFFENRDDLSGSKSMNLILYFGGTIGHHDDQASVLRNFRSGMGRDDILIFADKLDSQKNRVDLSHMYSKNILDLNGWIPEELGIDIDKCDIEARYDGDDKFRKLFCKLDKDYDIVFDILGREKVVSLGKGEEINIWKHRLADIKEYVSQIEKAGLRLANLEIDKDNSYMLAMCMVK